MAHEVEAVEDSVKEPFGRVRHANAAVGDPSPWPGILRSHVPQRADWESVETARVEFQRVNAENARLLRPLIDDYLRAYGAVLGELDEAHVLIAETAPFDLLGPSREAARWLLTGRCIGLAQAGLDLVRLGYSGEITPILRSLHEATRLLGVVCHQGEDDLVDRWIRGRNVSRGDIMHAADRQEQRIRVEMIRAGERPVSPTKSFFDGQHGRWSEFAHHRRRHIADQVAAPLRVMAKGPHPDWRTRAVAVDHYGDSLLELVVVGGSAVSQTLGPQWHHRFQRTIASFLELKAKVPLADVATGRAGLSAQGS